MTGGLNDLNRRVRALDADARVHSATVQATRRQLKERLRTFLSRPRTLLGFFAAGMLTARIRPAAVGRVTSLMSASLLAFESYTAASRLIGMTSKRPKTRDTGEVANGK